MGLNDSILIDKISETWRECECLHERSRQICALSVFVTVVDFKFTFVNIGAAVVLVESWLGRVQN